MIRPINIGTQARPVQVINRSAWHYGRLNDSVSIGSVDLCLARKPIKHGIGPGIGPEPLGRTSLKANEGETNWCYKRMRQGKEKGIRKRETKDWRQSLGFNNRSNLVVFSSALPKALTLFIFLKSPCNHVRYLILFNKTSLKNPQIEFSFISFDLAKLGEQCIDDIKIWNDISHFNEYQFTLTKHRNIQRTRQTFQWLH